MPGWAGSLQMVVWEVDKEVDMGAPPSIPALKPFPELSFSLGCKQHVWMWEVSRGAAAFTWATSNLGGRRVGTWQLVTAWPSAFVPRTWSLVLCFACSEQLWFDVIHLKWWKSPLFFLFLFFFFSFSFQLSNRVFEADNYHQLVVLPLFFSLLVWNTWAGLQRDWPPLQLLPGITMMLSFIKRSPKDPFLTARTYYPGKHCYLLWWNAVCGLGFEVCFCK